MRAKTMTNLHNFTRGSALNASTLARYLTPLSDDQIRARAPSVFAERPHESRSDRYAYIPTADILAGMRKAGFIPVSVQQSRSRVPGKSDFTKHMIKFSHVDVTNVRVGDSIPQVSLINSHDGTSQWELMDGLYRFVCSNGLMVCDATYSAVKVPHKGADVRDRVIEGSFTVINRAKEVGDRVEEWRGITLDRGEQLALAHAATLLRWDGQNADGSPIKPPVAAD